jgi:hypothetical protein
MEKNVPNGETGGGKLTRRKHSFRSASLAEAGTGWRLDPDRWLRFGLARNKRLLDQIAGELAAV